MSEAATRRIARRGRAARPPLKVIDPEVRTRIDVVQGSTGEVIRRTGDCVLNFEERSSSVFARYKVENCLFPEPGYYYVELYCEGEFIDDQVVHVVPP